jgi:DNA-binding response OmpR family regulator
MMRRLAVASLPVNDDEPHEERVFSSGGAKSEELPAPSTRRGRRVLVVEDDYLVGLTICDLLEGAGYMVLGPAVTGEEAVSLALDERPELVLMDVRLAGVMDGVDAAIEIARSGIRSLFVSAHSDSQTRNRGAAAKPHGWLEKPFGNAELLEAVAAALR